MTENEKEIWNIFHDGEIVEITKSDNSNLNLKIQIEYLRKIISDDGDSFVIKLKKCNLFELNYENRKLITNLDTIQEIKPIILKSKYIDNRFLIKSTAGEIKLSYESAQIYLDNGKEITFENLANACGKYWEELPKGCISTLPKIIGVTLILFLILYLLFKNTI